VKGGNKATSLALSYQPPYQ